MARLRYLRPGEGMGGMATNEAGRRGTLGRRWSPGCSRVEVEDGADGRAPAVSETRRGWWLSERMRARCCWVAAHYWPRGWLVGPAYLLFFTSVGESGLCNDWAVAWLAPGRAAAEK